MKLSELFTNANLSYPSELGEIDITEIVTDSRKACQGCLFICIKGERFDSHACINDVINAGARVIVAEKVRGVGEGGAAAICVENTRRAASLLYNSWYGVPSKNMKLVGVTGTNGKTSVASILKKIFEEHKKRCGFIGTLGCFVGDRQIKSESDDPTANMTTPDPRELYRILGKMRDLGVEYVFMEVSSHALSLCKVDALRFDTAVFTNFTQDHLDFHKDMESYFAAKSKLFSMCERAVINIDDPSAERMIRNARCEKIYTVSALSSADFYAENTEIRGALGIEYTLVTENTGKRVRIKTALSGRFSVINSLEAAAVASSLGVPEQTIVRALADIATIDGRMEKVGLGKDAPISVFIDYAHTPDALENLLRSVRDFREADQRIVLLFGCGGERDRGKRREMAQIASRLADFIIVTSDNSRGESTEGIISDILRGIDKEKEYTVIPDRRAAIEYAVCNSRPRDIILLAGKGHERYEIDSRGKHPFDEREIIRVSYSKLRGIFEGDIS